MYLACGLYWRCGGLTCYLLLDAGYAGIPGGVLQSLIYDFHVGSLVHVL
jgi:hypothetical protein